jgi:hypothetical protein
VEGLQGKNLDLTVSEDGEDGNASEHSDSELSARLKQGRAKGAAEGVERSNSKVAFKRKLLQKQPAAAADDTGQVPQVGPRRHEYSKGQSKADAAQRGGLGSAVH